MRLVDDTNGKQEEVLLHYCRAYHHLYQEILDLLDRDTKVTMIAPTLAADEMSICKVDRNGDPLPDYTRGVEYTLELFCREFQPPEKFLPLLEQLGETDPMIFHEEYDGSHPASLLRHPNLSLIVRDKYMSPFCRDVGFFCDEKTIVEVSPVCNEQKRTHVDVQALRDRRFRVVARRRPFNYDENGDIVTDSNTAFVSSSYLTLNFLSKQQLQERMQPLLDQRRLDIIPAGPMYHVDMYFAPADDETVCIGDLAAGRRILAENGMPLSEEECFASYVTQIGFTFDRRQDILDTLARQYSRTKKVFRIPVFTIRMGDGGFQFTPLNIYSDSEKLGVPTYAFKGYEEVGERMREVGRHVGKRVVEVRRMGGFDLRDAAIRCLMGNMRRSYGRHATQYSQ